MRRARRVQPDLLAQRAQQVRLERTVLTAQLALRVQTDLLAQRAQRAQLVRMALTEQLVLPEQ